MTHGRATNLVWGNIGLVEVPEALRVDGLFLVNTNTFAQSDAIGFVVTRRGGLHGRSAPHQPSFFGISIDEEIKEMRERIVVYILTGRKW